MDDSTGHDHIGLVGTTNLFRHRGQVVAVDVIEGPEPLWWVDGESLAPGWGLTPLPGGRIRAVRHRPATAMELARADRLGGRRLARAVG